MRLMKLVISDIRYQYKYGFYFLYAFVSLIYIGVLLFVPDYLLKQIAGYIIFSDPASLGFFFIGGIILLERSEGLHIYKAILPTSINEYVLSKILSLSIISSLVALIISVVTLRNQVNFVFLFICIFIGSGIFTLIGLIIGTIAKSLNQYFLISIIVGAIIMSPAFLIYFDIYILYFEVLPATLLLRCIYISLGLEMPYSFIIYLAGLIIWTTILYIYGCKTFDKYIQKIGG